MQAFTLGPRRWRTVRAFGVNPLVRISDRIEAIVVVSAVATSLLAAPVAGAIGTAVHDARSRVYAEEAHTRQPISAIVTTNGHSAAIARPYPTTAVVQARWRAKGVEHVATFRSERAAAAGDQIRIWVNEAGERVTPPTPASRAVFDAISVGLLLWLVVVGAVGALVALTRWRLDHHRDSDWAREVGDLVDRRWAD